MGPAPALAACCRPLNREDPKAGWPPKITARSNSNWSAIKRNWEAYWPRFAEYRVTMRVNKVNVSEPVAWVHGIETSHRRTKSGEVSNSHNHGTNIFVHRNDRWLLVF